MFQFLKNIFSNNRQNYQDIAPDEIFLDAVNRPEFDRNHMEGRLEKPIQKESVYILAAVILIIFIVFGGRLWVLQVQKGEAYEVESSNNHLAHETVFAPRGIVHDRSGEELAWNAPRVDSDFPARKYATTSGLAHVLGYVNPPQKDSSGNYYQTRYVGKDGVEELFSDYLSGKNGLKITEENAVGRQVSESVIQSPQNGNNLFLTIDAKLQSKLHELIRSTAKEHGYRGGAGVIMDVKTGELHALTNYPEYPPQLFVEGEDEEKIASLISDERTPFLNRASEGLYTPGSIVKPFMAVAALNEGVISPQKKILSTGELRVQNPYDPDAYTTFTDWKAHGRVNMREAIAVSSNVYFYQIGGGYNAQEGLGITNIERYMRSFGVGEMTGVRGLPEKVGVVPSPTWKEQRFEDGTWRLGDTYNTAIGQYGFQVTPLQMARATAAIANGGKLMTPQIAMKTQKQVIDVPINIPEQYYAVAQEGMRRAVTEGTAGGLDVSFMEVAAKTGTAEVSGKSQINSWVIGFFPYDDPQYAFTVVMEHGPRKNTIGGVYVMRRLFDWMSQTQSEYIPDT